MAEWEKRHDKYRKIIEEYMRDRDVVTIPHTDEHENEYEVKKLALSRETLAKKDVPVDVWEKYSKATRYTMIRLDKKKKK
jgi:hypothetical protein